MMWKPISNYVLKKGDIVTFKNSVTDTLVSTNSGFIKRIIATPGDTLELRDGQVLVNGSVSLEPYTALPNSTFGDDFLADCKLIKIPENQYFVMGDNRKTSDDSRRKLGLINKNDIEEVLPVFLQKFNYQPRNESAKISVNQEEFLKIINTQRQSPLKFNPLAKNNIATAELSVNGHYDAIELGEAAIEWWSKYFLDPVYTEINISETDKIINGCPTRTIKINLGGYLPPNWDKNVINSWQKALDRLKEIRPGWNNTPVATIIDTRIKYLEQIVAKMNSNQWLGPELELYIQSTDKKLYDKQTELSNKINFDHE